MIDLSIIGAPLIAGLLVVSTHVVLGRRVLERGVIFVDLAIAQVAALGVIIAQSLHWAEHGWAIQLSAGAAALSGALLLTWTDRFFGQLQEALIGSLYVLSACIGLLILAHNPHGAESMQALLAGQILWVTYTDLIPVALLYATVLVTWGLWARHHPGVFYLVFALAITASVQLVGVYLVFATLIIPAIAGFGLSASRGLTLGYALGAMAYVAGLLLSVPTDLPSGPLIVCAMAMLAVLSGLVRLWLNRQPRRRG